MATAVGFLGTDPWKSLCHKESAKPAGIVSLATKTISHLGRNRLERQQNAILGGRKIKNRTHRLYLVSASKGGSSFDSNSASPSEAIKDFYECINTGKLKRLGNYISADCYIEECSFPAPLAGKEEVLRFFAQLIASMGENVKFRVKQVCEGDQLIAAANWHLEWKRAEIPFTRGCTFFEFSKEEEKLVIKKAQIVIESPVKPGGLVLVLLKIVTKVFDDFPKTTERFLKSPHVVLKWLVNIYTILFGIFISPVLKGYLQIWNLTARVYSYFFHILLYILKIFLK